MSKWVVRFTSWGLPREQEEKLMPLEQQEAGVSFFCGFLHEPCDRPRSSTLKCLKSAGLGQWWTRTTSKSFLRNCFRRRQRTLLQPSSFSLTNPRVDSESCPQRWPRDEGQVLRPKSQGNVWYHRLCTRSELLSRLGNMTMRLAPCLLTSWVDDNFRLNATIKSFYCCKLKIVCGKEADEFHIY